VRRARRTSERWSRRATGFRMPAVSVRCTASIRAQRVGCSSCRSPFCGVAAATVQRLVAGTESSRPPLGLGFVAPTDDARGSVTAFPAGAVAGDQLNDDVRILTEQLTADRRRNRKVRAHPLHLDTHRRAGLGAGPQRDAGNAPLSAIDE